MITFGVILLIAGFILASSMLWGIGVILLVVGVILWLASSMGHAIGGRRHYY